MDRPVPEGVTIHDAGPLSLMGCMAAFPDFKSGDWVKYGGMLYKPQPDGRYAYTEGDYAPGGGGVWGPRERPAGAPSPYKHYLNLWADPATGTTHILVS
jgi:hypothetical protein